VEDTFQTCSGRDVALRIYVEHHNLDKADFAMASLIKSMAWDEEVFGLEYDLDLFNIVAVDDFNMGAMENKSLNIFNSRLILATPQTATDADYAAIEVGLFRGGFGSQKKGTERRVYRRSQGWESKSGHLKLPLLW
jgi:aminopeptidase N